MGIGLPGRAGRVVPGGETGVFWAHGERFWVHSERLRFMDQGPWGKEVAFQNGHPRSDRLR